METTVSLSDCGQAVRLPKAVAPPGDVKKVEITAISRIRIITPAGKSWDSWFGGENMSADLMDIRDRLAIRERELF